MAQFPLLKARCRDIFHRAFNVKFDVRPAKEGTHRDPNIAQCFRGQIARVPAPPAGNIFSSHVDEIGIYIMVGEVGNTFIPREFRPMF